jgi:hypothetical protein
LLADIPDDEARADAFGTKSDWDVRTGNIDPRSVSPEKNKLEASNGLPTQVYFVDRTGGNRILVS